MLHVRDAEITKEEATFWKRIKYYEPKGKNYDFMRIFRPPSTWADSSERTRQTFLWHWNNKFGKWAASSSSMHDKLCEGRCLPASPWWPNKLSRGILVIYVNFNIVNSHLKEGFFFSLVAFMLKELKVDRK